MKRLIWVTVAVGFLVTAQPILADNWEKLGERLVTFGTDRDTITVGARDGRFKKVKLEVRRNGVRILDMKIHYANGDVQDVKIRKFIKAGGQSRAIDLSGGNRVIEKVVFYYKSGKNRDKRSLVMLYGK